MDRIPVSSSNISSVGYDASAMTLEVEFSSGHIYQYFDVPESVYQELSRANSVGGYLAKNIKNVYRYTRT